MTTNKIRIAGIFALSLALLIPATAGAVIETFDSYPLHVNSTPVSPPGGAPGNSVYWIYGDAPTNQQIIASWSENAGGEDGNNLNLVVPVVGDPGTSAGIASNGSEQYAFVSGGGENPGQGYPLGIMDFGMQQWGMTHGIIADFLGPDGRDLHGGAYDAGTQLVGFPAQIQLGFVSDMEADYDVPAEPGFVEFYGPTFDTSDFFDWYHGDLDDFRSDFDDTRYGDLPGVKVLGVWIDLINNTPIPVTAEIIDGQYDISGEMQVDQINLVPEPTTLGLIFIGSLALLRRRSGNSYAEPKP